MDRRHTRRVNALLPVRVWGVDAKSAPFLQLATARNISGSGALLQGLRLRVKPGQTISVQFGEEQAQFVIVWVGRAGTPLEGEIGIKCLASEPAIWQLNLPQCCEFVANG